MRDQSTEPAGPSPYENAALGEIQAWKNPPGSLLRKAFDVLSWPINKAGELALDTPGVGFVLRKTVSGLVDLGNEVAQLTVRPEAIYAEFRKGGHADVHAAADIHKLDLQDADRIVGYLAAKYKALAATEGAAAGAIGLPGIPPDIIALISLNLRAIGKYATYYGFDLSSQHERLFAMNILGLSSSPTDTSKALAMAELVKIAQDVARKKAWRDLQQHAFVRVIQQIAKALGIRLTKAKWAQASTYISRPRFVRRHISSTGSDSWPRSTGLPSSKARRVPATTRIPRPTRIFRMTRPHHKTPDDAPTFTRSYQEALNKVATITGTRVTQHSAGVTVAADCFGNNAAILCPGCKHPISLTARPNQRGSDAKHPVPCPSCGRAT